MDFYLDKLLNFPNVTVFTCYQKEGFTFLQLDLLNSKVKCDYCNFETDEIHQNRPILIRDLSICGHHVYLKVPRRQIYCPHCQKYSTEKLEFMEKGSKYTIKYEEYIYEKVKELTVKQVAVNEDLSEEQVQNIFSKMASQKKNWEFPTRISMDEISKRKGKRDFATVVSDIDSSSLIDVIDSHKSEEIREELSCHPLEIRENVQEVSVDMCQVFHKVIPAVFPNAIIVVDRFHVMKLINKSVNKIRLILGLKGLKNRCLIMKNNQDLNEEEKEDLKQLLNNSPILAIAYELKEEFRRIYEDSTTVKMGIRKIQKWLISAKIILGTTAQTIEKYIKEICHYFINRTTSGVMEGINNKIKLILRQSYGFKDFKLLKEKLLACLF